MSLNTSYSKIKDQFATNGLKGGLKAAGDVISPSILKVLDSFAGKATLAVGAAALLYTGLNKLSDAYNLSYDSALKNTQTNLNNFNNTKSDRKSVV